jgi:hypothetical protein
MRAAEKAVAQNKFCGKAWFGNGEVCYVNLHFVFQGGMVVGILSVATGDGCKARGQESMAMLINE